MKKFLLLLVLCPVFLGANETSRDDLDMERGCFLLYDLDADAIVQVHNEEQVQIPLSPCSTFKIPNALIGLDLGVLENELTRFEWDGSKQWLPIWEQDHSLLSAIRYSCVWYFQEVAQKVGTTGYKNYLTKLNYGNRDISGGLTTFWLGSSLKISPQEQLQFLVKLANNDLPVSEHALTTVKKTLVLEEKEGRVLSGKTGSSPDQNIGWFVGYLTAGEKHYAFVTCLRGDTTSGPKARALTKQILNKLVE